MQIPYSPTDIPKKLFVNINRKFVKPEMPTPPMFPKIILPLLLFINVYAIQFTPKLDIDVSAGALIPSNQKIYTAYEFAIDDNGSPDPVDTLVHITDFVQYMPEYAIACRFGQLSQLKLALAIKLEHFFNSSITDSRFFRCAGCIFLPDTESYPR